MKGKCVIPRGPRFGSQFAGRQAVCLLAWLAGIAAAPAAQARWTTAEADVDGVRISVEMWSNRRVPAELADGAIDEYARVRGLTDAVNPGSELALVNALAAAQAVEVGAELFALVDLTLELAERTGGAFDPTTAAVSGTSAVTNGVPLDFRSVELDRERGTVRFAAPQLRLDPTAVAAGHALAHAAAYLRANGVEHARLVARGIAYYIGDHRRRPWLHAVGSVSEPSDAPNAPSPPNALNAPNAPNASNAPNAPNASNASNASNAPNARNAPNAPGSAGRLAQLSLSDVAVASVGSFALLLENEPVILENEASVVPGVPSRRARRLLRSATVVGPDPLIAEGLAEMILGLGAVAGFERLRAFPGYDAVVFDWSGQVAHTVGLNVVYGGR